MKDGGLRDLFRHHLKAGWHWQTVEMSFASPGAPDLNGCSQGIEVWVEMKQTKEWAVTLEVEQIGWALARTRRGGRVFIAVRRRHEGGPRIGKAVDELWLLRGSFARELRALGLRRCPPAAVVGVWPGGVSGWAWNEVRAALVG